MSHWVVKPLGDVLTLQRGFDITKKEQRPGQVPVVSSSGISSFHDQARAPGPGVVVGRKGSLGTTFYMRESFWPHDTTLWVKDFKGSDPYYCYSLLQSLGLRSLDVGSSNPTLNRNHVHLIQVRMVPDLRLQQRITAVLSAFDKLIEINHRRIELLEDLARSLYREWFVQFRFPGHQDSAFIETSLGTIPKGWSVRTLGASAKWLSGGTPSTTEPSYWNGDIPWITSGSLTSVLLDSSDRQLTESGAQNGTRLVDKDALLFVVRGMSLVREFRVGIAERRLAFGQDVKGLVAHEDIEPLFLAFAVLHRQDEIQSM
ncbi:MAG: restriction endonuclease subunit S, partial [Alphaproteobacteria bacterium]